MRQMISTTILCQHKWGKWMRQMSVSTNEANAFNDECATPPLYTLVLSHRNKSQVTNYIYGSQTMGMSHEPCIWVTPTLYTSLLSRRNILVVTNYVYELRKCTWVTDQFQSTASASHRYYQIIHRRIETIYASRTMYMSHEPIQVYGKCITSMLSTNPSSHRNKSWVTNYVYESRSNSKLHQVHHINIVNYSVVTPTWFLCHELRIWATNYVYKPQTMCISHKLCIFVTNCVHEKRNNHNQQQAWFQWLRFQSMASMIIVCMLGTNNESRTEYMRHELCVYNMISVCHTNITHHSVSR